MIDFKSTAQTGDTIEFVNDKGQTVRSYPLSELEDFVLSNHLNSYFEEELVSGSGIPSDPNNVFKEVEVITPLGDYIDNKWEEVTKQFYTANNPHEFKSANREQETRKVVAR